MSEMEDFPVVTLSDEEEVENQVYIKFGDCRIDRAYVETKAEWQESLARAATWRIR